MSVAHSVVTGLIMSEFVKTVSKLQTDKAMEQK